MRRAHRDSGLEADFAQSRQAARIRKERACGLHEARPMLSMTSPEKLCYSAFFASLRLCAKLPIPFLMLLFSASCGGPTVPVPGSEEAYKTAAAERAKRRAFDGAPPVIAHEPLGADCSACHTMQGIHIDGLGFAPPSPHRETAGMSAISRCRQCHIFQESATEFAESTFVGFQQDLRQGRRLFDGAPPVIPHQSLMRENCTACHSGPAAREEVRTSHPERVRCQQCHVVPLTAETLRLGVDVAGGS